ncbi:(2Fe-2S) ferredoxin domain-containing protein [Candidatus Halobeggiatoa sp. HSG11]|nr:(2Fe-2S) ferredoxin domain-containing protein [Candidatus Halobeggiatoa sp. HSG11]
MADSYYNYHIFFCTNQRSEGEHCCQNFQAQEMRNYLKKRTKELNIIGKGKVRSNTAGCMDRCQHGPVLVIYPEETWYTFKDKADIDEIITEHLQNGRLVERLLILEN